MTIVSVRVGRLGRWGRRNHPRPGLVEGLRFARTFDVLKLRPSGHGLPRLRVTGFVSIWDGEEALDAWEAGSVFLADASGIRLAPFGQHLTHPDIGELCRGRSQVSTGPIAGITYGHLRNAATMPRFMATGARATRAVMESTDLLAIASMSNVQRLEFCTFSLWRDLAGMRATIEGARGATGHRDAIRERTRKPFFKTETFLRLRPLPTPGCAAVALRELDRPWRPFNAVLSR